MCQFVEENPPTTAILQNDQSGRFMRSLLVAPGLLHLYNRGLLLPLIQIDGGHSRDPFYDGVYINGTMRTGLGTNYPAFFAAVPVEDTNNLVWILLFLMISGLPLWDFATFTDRGALMSATAVIYHWFGTELSLKFDREHLIRNVNHEFKDLMGKGNKFEQNIRNAIIAYCGADSMANWIRVVMGFPDCLGPDLGYHMMGYLVQTHPIHYVVVANSLLWDEETATTVRIKCLGESLQFIAEGIGRKEHFDKLMMRRISGQLGPDEPPVARKYLDQAKSLISSQPACPRGKIKRMFGVATTNMVESEMQLSHCTRTTVPPIAVPNWVKMRVNSSIQDLTTSRNKYRL
jgi:hypothetical protein